MGYIWYKIKIEADKAIKEAAPFAEIKYGSIHLSPLGDEVGLKNIVVALKMTQDEFHIEHAYMTGPYPGYFLTQAKNLTSDTPPNKLGVEIRHLEIDLNSELMAMLEEIDQQTPQTNTIDVEALLFDMDALGCGNKTSFALEDYRKMGIDVLNLDITGDITYDEVSNKMQIRNNTNANGLYSLDSKFEITMGPNGKFTPDMFDQGLPKSMLEYQDIGYHTLRNEYCTDLNNSNLTSYIDRNFTLVSQEIGLELTDETTAAYKNFKRDGGKMTINMNPSTNLSFSDLKYYKPVDIINMLGINVGINGTTLDFKSSNAKATPHKEPKKTQKPKKPFDPHTLHRSLDREQANSDTNTSNKPSYKTIKVCDAHRHINKQIEVTTYEGKVRSGILEKVNNNRLYLIMKLSAGGITYPVEIDNIDKLRVKL